MSCYEWENGIIAIPAKELPALHKALRDWQNAFHKEVRAKAIELHKIINTRSVTKYQEGIAELERKRYAREAQASASAPSNFSVYAFGRTPAKPSPQQQRAGIVEDEALNVLRYIQYYAAQGKKGIHQPTVEDVSQYAPAATNRTKRFYVGGEASITFDKNNVIWDVPENNHACDHAAGHPLHGVFFGALEKIQWTRGSGGVISGNNEYNRDTYEHGGGANFISYTFGPKGSTAKVRNLLNQARG